MDFLDALAKRARTINAALDRYLPPENADPQVIHAAMRYSVFAGGKRIRPALTLAAADAVGGNPEHVLPAACAIELIHTYSLIHDDLPAMDNDDLRRGKPTNHKVFGEDIAILAGDALFTHALHLLVLGGRETGPDPVLLLTVVEEVTQACGSSGLIGGQVMDLLAGGKPVSEEDLVRIHRAKTGALFRVGVRAGAILSGAGLEQLASLTTYAENFGLAFQITDDILDVTGDEAKIGKLVGSDARNRKSTYATLFGIGEARAKADRACSDALAALDELGREADFLRHAVQFVAAREY
ncbi:MAG: polyprenyl synthetase family protein [Clostridia bacterium]|nr:polyprenyl synthetase family protein [Clostridia bacterium]MDQ7790558.1 polyprenyl synthetase family protein [Clostridia bacterium]